MGASGRAMLKAIEAKQAQKSWLSWLLDGCVTRGKQLVRSLEGQSDRIIVSFLQNCSVKSMVLTRRLSFNQEIEEFSAL